MTGGEVKDVFSYKANDQRQQEAVSNIIDGSSPMKLHVMSMEENNAMGD